VNDWCDEHTDGMIPSIVDRLDPSSKLVMMDAVLLKATWAEKFDPANTQKGRFKNSRTPIFQIEYQ
jgi:serpin B